MSGLVSLNPQSATAFIMGLRETLLTKKGAPSESGRQATRLISRLLTRISDRDPYHGRGHDRPNRGLYASDARLHPTICGPCPSNTPAPHAAGDALAPPVDCSIRDAPQLREACGRP
jgi:hypothetical protein